MSLHCNTVLVFLEFWVKNCFAAFYIFIYFLYILGYPKHLLQYYFGFPRNSCRNSYVVLHGSVAWLKVTPNIYCSTILVFLEILVKILMLCIMTQLYAWRLPQTFSAILWNSWIVCLKDAINSDMYTSWTVTASRVKYISWTIIPLVLTLLLLAASYC